jgi:hypothetical protein
VATERRILLVARRGKRVLLTPGAAAGSAWALPNARVPTRPRRDDSAARARTAALSRTAARRLARALFAEADVTGPRGLFSHRTYSEDLRFEVWEAKPGRSGTPRGGEWVDPSRLGERHLRSPTIKALKVLRLI